MSQKEREQLHAEFAILSSLRHPNGGGYDHREHLKTTQDLHLYMEYCGNGDLGRVIKDLQLKNQYAEEGFVWSMFSQLVTALFRCHYGVDPPEVGSNIMGLGNSAKPRQPAGGVMILHRDLKPENGKQLGWVSTTWFNIFLVFLGEDNSVKLGDFGLSKIMQSHDFASTYVGTPFYMSPEICAAERYTLKSDIWSLGCIIYELCSREPPFNAKSHFQLVQKIKEGKIAPLPPVYSPELNAVIKDCLKVNPDRRPDTATLLNLPVVKLMRKEKEVVELGRMVKNKEQLAAKRLQDAEEQLKNLDAEKAQMRQETESSLRREWEVKAQLEINRLVQLEIERLQKKFDQEVRERVEAELQKRSSTQSQVSAKDFSGSGPLAGNDIPLSSVSTNGDCDFPSSTDLTELSLDSPDPTKALKKSARTPFGRAQTMFAGTPMDIEMAEPSPISIASLSLSPRRNGATKAPNSTRNIFAAANGAAEARWQPALINSDDSDDDDLPVPSPTRPKSGKNPFKSNGGRPPLISQKTAPIQKQTSQPSIFAAGKANTAPVLPTLSNAPDLRPQASNTALKERSPSPNRRLSKIPSSTNLISHENIPLSPTRKSSLTKKNASGGEDLNKIATKNNMAIKASSGGNLAPKGRTLVELAQARAGGRPIDDGHRSPEPKGKAFAARMAEKEKGEPPVWNPETDEMPSPFLVRKRVAAPRA
jgi:NIMA (never in mitosis gene a)-related kinase 2